MMELSNVALAKQIDEKSDSFDQSTGRKNTLTFWGRGHFNKFDDADDYLYELNSNKKTASGLICWLGMIP